MITIFKIFVSLLPVFVFLLTLILLDSYKLIKPASIIISIFYGCITAIICFFLVRLFIKFEFDVHTYSIYEAPVIEEILKASLIIYLLKSNKIGFMVDAAIFGFAIGSGFAFIENIYYIQSIESSNQLIWIIRGFGTAIMHGSTTAIFAVISKTLIDRKNNNFVLSLLPGLLLAVMFHSIFNQFVLPPITTTLLQLIVMPVILLVVFKRSEAMLQNWMDLSFETDMNLIAMINSNEISRTKIGKYLYSIKKKFSNTIVLDMFCFLKIYTELAISAKGTLLMKEAGFNTSTSQDIKEKFEELKYLQKSIGTTGRLALSPILKSRVQDLWQLYFLEKK